MKTTKTELVQQFEQDENLFITKMKKRISEGDEMKVYRDIFDVSYEYFYINHIKEASQSLTILIDPVALFNFISNDQDKELYLSEKIPFPPYDLFVLCALLSYDENEVEVQNRFFFLFKFHTELLTILKSKLNDTKTESTVWLNDLYEPAQKTILEAIQIENSRLLYISELLIILYHSMPPNQLLINFIDTVFYRNFNFEPNDAVYSVIGRIMLSNGELEKAQDFFEKVVDEYYRKLNDAFIKFFLCKFNEAEKAFKEIDDPIAKVNRAAALVYLGKIDEAKAELSSAIHKETSLINLKSVYDNHTFLSELTTIDYMKAEKTLLNFPSNSSTVRVPL